MQENYNELYQYYADACDNLRKQRIKCEQLSAENFELKAKLGDVQRSLDALRYRISLENSLEQPSLMVKP
jgi:hypothetical protein